MKEIQTGLELHPSTDSHSMNFYGLIPFCYTYPITIESFVPLIVLKKLVRYFSYYCSTIQK